MTNSYRAYSTHFRPSERLWPKFSNDQLFFIKLGQVWCTKATADAAAQMITDVHSPGPFRVLGPLSNFKPYAVRVALHLLFRIKSPLTSVWVVWSGCLQVQRRERDGQVFGQQQGLPCVVDAGR